MQLFVPESMLKKHTSDHPVIAKALAEMTGEDHPFYWWNKHCVENKLGYVELNNNRAILRSVHIVDNIAGDITQKCPNCGDTITIRLPLDAMITSSQPIQDILPLDTPEFREVLISGLCFACQI